MSEKFSTCHKNFTFEEFLQQTLMLKLDDCNLSEQELENCYEEYKNARFLDLNQENLTIDLDKTLPEKTAVKLNAVLLEKTNEGYKVGFANPFHRESVDEVASILNEYIEPVLVKAKDLRRFIRLIYRKVDAVKAYANNISPSEVVTLEADLINSGSEYSIPGLVNLIIRDAFEINASDIHVEADRDKLQIRVRVDGSLQHYTIGNQEISSNLVRYLRLLSDVDVTQERLPVDGKKVTLWLDDQEVHLRFSFMPTYYGQSVVIRILGDASTYQLEEKITSSEYLDEIKKYLQRTYGMFLISGPTGSGKTTTLYSALSMINDDERKIITLEDPVEARIPGLSQVQINENAGYSFAKGIRASLRQDPDVIMIGEIRDEDTANMAIRAAITGHLVMASIHTRGVVEIPIRLLNLEVDPYLLAAALRLNVSQRLVRLLCPNCKTTQALTEEMSKYLAEKFPHKNIASVEFHHGTGCRYCQQTGYSGRTAVFEILYLTQEMIHCLAKDDVAGYMQLANTALKDKTLMDRALQMALSGETSIAEVLRLETD